MMPRPRAVPAPLLARLCLAAWLLLAAPLVQADPLQEANRLLKQGQLAAALEKTDQLLAAKPKDAQARFLKGLILTEMNRHNDAIAVFTKLTEDYPELPEPYNNLAVLYAQQRQYEKAKNALEMAIRTHPSYATAHENLGDIYARLASQAYDKALQLDSSNASAQTKLALIRELMSVSARPQSVPRPAAPPPAAAPAPQEAKPISRAEPAPAAAGAAAQPVTEDRGEIGHIEQLVRDWAAAWSRKDVKAYLAFYAADFQTPGGQPRSVWEAERIRRIDKPDPIQVTVENLQVQVEGERATVRFRQHYRSGRLRASASKFMELVRREGRWLIVQERVAG